MRAQTVRIEIRTIRLREVVPDKILPIRSLRHHQTRQARAFVIHQKPNPFNLDAFLGCGTPQLQTKTGLIGSVRTSVVSLCPRLVPGLGKPTSKFYRISIRPSVAYWLR